MCACTRVCLHTCRSISVSIFILLIGSISTHEAQLWIEICLVYLVTNKMQRSFPRTPKFEVSQLYRTPSALFLSTSILICSFICSFLLGLAIKRERERDREGRGGKLFLSHIPKPDSIFRFNLMTSLVTLLNLSFHEMLTKPT